MSEPRVVYLVTAGEYSGYHICGAFSDMLSHPLFDEVQPGVIPPILGMAEVER